MAGSSRGKIRHIRDISDFDDENKGTIGLVVSDKADRGAGGRQAEGRPLMFS